MELRVRGAVTVRMSQQRSSRFMPGPSRVQSAKVTEKSSPGRVHTPRAVEAARPWGQRPFLGPTLSSAERTTGFWSQQTKGLWTGQPCVQLQEGARQWAPGTPNLPTEA